MASRRLKHSRLSETSPKIVPKTERNSSLLRIPYKKGIHFLVSNDERAKSVSKKELEDRTPVKADGTRYLEVINGSEDFERRYYREKMKGINEKTLGKKK